MRAVLDFGRRTRLSTAAAMRRQAYLTAGLVDAEYLAADGTRYRCRRAAAPSAADLVDDAPSLGARLLQRLTRV